MKKDVQKSRETDLTEARTRDRLGFSYKDSSIATGYATGLDIPFDWEPVELGGNK